jgi:hypothetical protein
MPRRWQDAPANSAIGTPVALLFLGKRKRRTPGTVGLPPRPCSSQRVARFRNPRPNPRGPWVFPPNRNRPPSKLLSLNTPKHPVPASLPPLGGIALFMAALAKNCRLQIADCKLANKNCVLNDSVFQAAICNLQFPREFPCPSMSSPSVKR